MGLYLRQNDDRSRLQQRLDEELRAKAKARAAKEAETPDGVDDSRYVENTKSTSSLVGIWLVIVVLALAVLIFYITQSMA